MQIKRARVLKAGQDSCLPRALPSTRPAPPRRRSLPVGHSLTLPPLRGGPLPLPKWERVACVCGATRPKEMGADVAASPHCPVAVGYQAWEARQSAGRFRGGRRAGGSDHFPRGPSGARAPFGFPRGLPVRAEALAVRLGRSGTGVPAPAIRDTEAEARGRLRQDSLGRSLSPAWRSMDLRPGSAGSQLPGRSPVLPDASGAEAPSPPVAARRLASRFCRTGTGPKPLACRFDPGPEGPKPGRFTKPAAFASAQGQARSFRLAAASSAALAFARPPHAWWDRRPLRSGCGWEGFPPLPVDRLGHGSEAVRESESRQGDSDCG